MLHIFTYVLFWVELTKRYLTVTHTNWFVNTSVKLLKIEKVITVYATKFLCQLFFETFFVFFQQSQKNQ